MRTFLLNKVSRKALLASFLLASSVFTTTAMAQTQDGRDFSIDGFAAYEGTPGTNWYRAGGTTGGASGKVVKANTFSELQAYLQAEDPYVVIVDHDISTGIKCYVDGIDTGKLLDDQSGFSGVETTYGERILVASNKTLIGVVDPATGKAPLFTHITFVMQCVDNIIIRNCRFTMKGVPVLKTGENKIVALRNGAQVEVGDPDCIGIQADKTSAKTDWGGHIWIDHCEFFNGGAANKDRYDGLLDCKNNVQWLTFSYNYFHDHDKSCLWGKGDSDVFDNCRTISFHHNFFDNIQGSRLPLQRGGHVHYYNNYMKGCEDGWDVRPGAIAYEEACYFENSKSPGAGKVEIWKAYTDAIPTVDIDEFDHAIKNYSTAKTYDAKGNELKGATTGISIAETSSVSSAIIRTEYYDLAGSRLSSPQRGVNIVKSIHANGQSTTKKVVF